MQEENLRKQEESVQKQEQMRRCMCIIDGRTDGLLLLAFIVGSHYRV